MGNEGDNEMKCLTKNFTCTEGYSDHGFYQSDWYQIANYFSLKCEHELDEIFVFDIYWAVHGRINRINR